jgi:H+-transporting ATPase
VAANLTDGSSDGPLLQVNPILLFLSYFWGPMPIMIWVAIIIELVKAILTGEGWEDFGVLLVLQVSCHTVRFPLRGFLYLR